jgi:voltage-gated potassium channel
MIARVANSPRLLAASFLALLVTSSMAYAVAERVNVLDGAYWTLITASTVGYGDLLPKTLFTKVLSVVVIGCAWFLTLMAGANLAATLIVNRDAFTHDEQEQLKNMLGDALAKLDELGSRVG